ncbi:MAG: hypothetical protein NC541_11060 [bacterium]|nr:hypothetical protein [bacterium]MCM1542640.1 hypothetical protein [Blautia sp.]
MKFTEKELLTISSGLINLIKNAKTAEALVTGEESRNAIEKEIAMLVDLNVKVCDLIKEVG